MDTPEKKTTVTTRLSEDLYRRIKARAELERRTVSHIFEYGMNLYVQSDIANVDLTLPTRRGRKEKSNG